MRLGVRTMLEREGFTIAGATATCSEALGLLEESRTDVVLLDLRLPDATGAEAVIRLREAAPSLPIVAFSVDRTPALVRAVLRAGANGYRADRCRAQRRRRWARRARTGRGARCFVIDRARVHPDGACGEQ